jgi:hypothetical protein
MPLQSGGGFGARMTRQCAGAAGWAGGVREPGPGFHGGHSEAICPGSSWTVQRVSGQCSRAQLRKSAPSSSVTVRCSWPTTIHAGRRRARTPYSRTLSRTYVHIAVNHPAEAPGGRPGGQPLRRRRSRGRAIRSSRRVGRRQRSKTPLAPPACTAPEIRHGVCSLPRSRRGEASGGCRRRYRCDSGSR